MLVSTVMMIIVSTPMSAVSQSLESQRIIERWPRKGMHVKISTVLPTHLPSKMSEQANTGANLPASLSVSSSPSAASRTKFPLNFLLKGSLTPISSKKGMLLLLAHTVRIRPSSPCGCGHCYGIIWKSRRDLGSEGLWVLKFPLRCCRRC